MSEKIYQFNIKQLNDDEISLNKFKGKVILVVNTASKCGLTYHYKGLEKLYQEYKGTGFVIIGFPCNQFGKQEPGTDKEIKDFCETNFNISFPITTKTDVKGKYAHEIYKWALKNHGNSTVPKWNFHKILINNEGKVEDVYLSFTNPLSKKLVRRIEIILN